MIPFLLIGGGAYLIFEALGTNRPSFDPLDYGFPTKGYRGYRKGKSYLASGGKVTYSDPNKFYYYQRFNGAIGGFGWKYDKKYNEGIIYPLDEFDNKYYAHIKLKPDEKLFRYKTDKMQKEEKYLIKMNIEKGLIYFMSDSEDDKNPKFDTRGIKAEYIQLDKSLYRMAKGGTVSNPYEDFLLANGFDKAYQVKKDGFTEYRKGKWFAQINTRTKEINAGKYIKDYSYADIKKYGGIRENSPFYSSDRYTNSLSKFKKFLDDYYALDEVKMAKGGEIKSYKDFKAKLLDLANQESDRNAFAEKVKSDLKKYIPLYFSNSRRDILNVTDNQYRLYMTKPGQYAKELNSITWESIYDKLKGKMEKGGETSLIGKRIRLIKMENDPRPVEPGIGTIKHVGGGVYNVDWDNGRSLGVVEGEDEFIIIN